MDNEALIAAKEGNLEKIEQLLEQGININAQDVNGDTLLHHAARNSQQKVLIYLLQNGADVLVTNRENTSVLHITVMDTHEDLSHILIVLILQRAGRDKLKELLDMKIKSNGNSALHIAAKYNSYNLNAGVLLEYGANFEMKNNAGEKPVDVANLENLRNLFEQIDKCFRQAKNGDHQFISDFLKINPSSIAFLKMTVFNCRNNEGHTIAQLFVLNDHFELMSDLMESRCEGITKLFRNLNDQNRKKEFNMLMKHAREFQEYWREKRQAMIGLTYKVKDKQRPKSKSMSMFIYTSSTRESIVKLACQALEKAHEVYLQYRKFDGKERAFTTDTAMKTLEEMLEILGFNPEELFIINGKETSYYEKLPSKYKENVAWWLNFMDQTIHTTICYLLRNLYSMQIFEAVKTNDVDKVKNLLKNGGSLFCLDYQNRSALCYAVEIGNKKMIRLLIKSGAILGYNGVVSPICMAIDNGNAKAVKLILKNIEAKDVARLVDHRQGCENTALHVAAKKGRLDIVKILLSHGATYLIFNENDQTPHDVSTNVEVSGFLKVVDECFQGAKAASNELVFKLKALQSDEFMAVASTRNNEGQTLAVVAAKAGAKNIALYILKMIKEIKQDEE